MNFFTIDEKLTRAKKRMQAKKNNKWAPFVSLVKVAINKIPLSFDEYKIEIEYKKYYDLDKIAKITISNGKEIIGFFEASYPQFDCTIVDEDNMISVFNKLKFLYLQYVDLEYKKIGKYR